MKKLFFLAAAALFAASLFGQNNIWAKGFLDVSTQPRFTFFLQKNDTAQSLIHRQTDQNINYMISMAFEQNENLFWEIGFRGAANGGDATYFDLTRLAPASPNVVVGSYAFSDFTIHVSRNKKRFEAQNGKKAWRYFWGTAIDLHHRRTEFSATDAGFWSGERNYSGASFSLMPRIQRAAGKRAFFELVPHFSVLDMGFEQEFIGNPQLASAQQRSNSFDLAMFNTIGIRFGVAYRLNKLKKEGPDGVD